MLHDQGQGQGHESQDQGQDRCLGSEGQKHHRAGESVNWLTIAART